MDLRRLEMTALNNLGSLWKTTPGAEFEAMLTGLDLTGWQDVIQYLRSLGMREAPQLVKLNICLSNDIRLTLEGAGVIQAYCRDNRIGDKPFVAMLKENITDAEPVSLGSYAAKAKLKREVPLAADDARVKEALARWDQLGKHFRNIQRFEFVAPGAIPLRFDISIVRENAGKPARTFQEAHVTTQPPRYEVEVELTASRATTTPEKAASLIIRGLSWLLQGRQRSFVLTTIQASDYVLGSLNRIFNGGSGGGSNRNRGGRGQFRFPGPQPATLERRNLVDQSEPGVPNLRSMRGGYNVTDKADGLRCLLFVAENGRVFLVDGGGRVYSTSKQVDPAAAAGVVLDGEWIRRDRKGAVVCHYYAFDILAAKGGDTSITAQPFMIAGAMFGSAATVNTRQSAMATYVGLLGASSDPAVRGVPSSETLQVGMKTFRACVQGHEIFQKGAAATLEDAKSAPYNTDGLIFTPNAAPLPLCRGTWYDQLKWKPPHDNTIDFLVIVEKERDAKGLLLAADAVGTKYREDSGQTVRYKTLRLFVGSNKDGAFSDPRSTVLNAAEPLPRSLDEGEWREVEFRPVDPRDRMASICYVAMGEGSGDPAGATAAATAIDGATDLIKTTRTGDTIQSDMIVEMAYHPERAPGWRWEPIRVRHDKTERWLAQQSGAGGRKSGTMNADWVANSIWNTIHNPVTEEAVRTGRVEHCGSVPALVSAVAVGGGGSNSRRADLVKVQCMRNFHDYVKRILLRRSLLPAGAVACDLATGNGEDVGKWISAGISFFLGCDVQAAALNDRDDGAYRRLLTKMVELGGRDQVPPMLFAQADMGRVLRDGHAGSTAEDGELLRQAFAGPLAGGADLTSCLFALPYVFRDENTVAGFLTNLADTIKVGGYFVGCCTDGDAMARLLASSPDKSVVGRDGRSDTWLLTKRYGSEIGSSVPPSAAGLGLPVEIEQVAAGTIHTEFLVSWPYLQARLAECGLDLLTPEETTTLGLPASTQMFRETWLGAESGGDVFAMTDSLKQLSFLNRWFVFKRRSDRGPAPPSLSVTLAASVPRGLTEAARPTASEAAVLGLAPVSATTATTAPAPSGIAAALSVIPEGTESVAETPDVIELVAESKQYLVSAANRTPDLRLGPDLADWPRYLSLGMQNTAVFTIPDIADPSVRYASVEAAIAAAKYQRATNKAEMGATLFKIDGTIHQKFEKEREKLIATGAPPEALDKSIDDEVAMVRIISGKAKMGGYKAVWDPAAWEAPGGRDDVYPAYLAKRFAVDGRFRDMIEAIRAKGGEILFVNGVDPSYLGVGVRVDGSISGGDNKVGRWMMSLT